MKAHWFAVLATIVVLAPLGADGPGDNLVDKVRPVPPPGIKLAPADHQELTQGIGQLGNAIAELQTDLQGKPALLELLPDVQIYRNAVRYAVQHNEFFKAAEIVVARKLLQ